MRSYKKLLMWIGISGSSLFAGSCVTASLAELRDGALAGARAFVQTEVGNLLDANLGTP